MNDLSMTIQELLEENNTLKKKIREFEQKEAEHCSLEDKLEKSEARFRGYFDLPFHGIAITSPEKGWIEVNDRLCNILGYEKQEIINKTWSEMTHSDDLVADIEQFNHVLSGRINQYCMDKRFIRKDGTVVWTNLSVGCARKSNGEVDHFVVLIEDISERKQAEEVLRKSEQAKSLLLDKLNEAQKIAHIGSWDWDISNDNVWWSDETYRIFDVDPGSFIPSVKENATFFHHEDRAAFMEKFNQAIQTGKTLNTYLRLVTRAGVVKHCRAQGKILYDPEGNPLHYVGTIMDVTFLMQMEEIRILNARLSQILNGLDALVYVVDMKTYEVIFINTYGKNVWGDIQGKICWQTIQVGQTGPCAFCTNDQLLGTDGSPTGGIDWEFQNTVNKRWYNCRDRAIYWPDGRIVRMEIATDITERKVMMAELESSYQQLRVLNQRWVEIEELERKRLSAELHDEIGQNLTALGINFDILKMSLPPATDSHVFDRIDDSINLLKRSSAQMKSIMYNLRPALLDDYGLVAALHWYVRESAKRTGIKISCVAEELPFRPAAEIETALFRIVQESVNNAVKHALAKRIRLTLKHEHAENRLSLVIADNGVGFEIPLFPEQDSHGWGLMIIKERCAGIKGICRIESRPGRGTKISIEVPI